MGPPGVTAVDVACYGRGTVIPRSHSCQPASGQSVFWSPRQGPGRKRKRQEYWRRLRSRAGRAVRARLLGTVDGVATPGVVCDIRTTEGNPAGRAFSGKGMSCPEAY